MSYLDDIVSGSTVKQKISKKINLEGIEELYLKAVGSLESRIESYGSFFTTVKSISQIQTTNKAVKRIKAKLISDLQNKISLLREFNEWDEMKKKYPEKFKK